MSVEQREEGTFHQAGKGRPGKNTKYVKELKKRFEISWSIDPIRLAEAEVMVTELSPLQKQILGLLGISAKSYGHQ